MINLVFLNINLPELKFGFDFANVSFMHILIHAFTLLPNEGENYRFLTMKGKNVKNLKNSKLSVMKEKIAEI